MCNITVSLVEKRSDSIFVQGRSNCGNVVVKLLEAGPLISTVDDNGNWKVTFTSNEFSNFESIACPQTIKTDIFCVDDTTCKGPLEVGMICEGDTCPSIILKSTEIAPCDSNGDRIVTFDIDISNAPDPTVLEIDYGDGVDENIVSNGDGTITKTHTYNPGTYTVIVNTIFPVGCPCPSSNSVEVDVICDISCPDDVNFEIIDARGNRFRALDAVSGPYQQINDNPGSDQIDCLPDGDYTVKIVEPSGTIQDITWRVDDNPPTPTDLSDLNVHLNSGDQKVINVIISKQNCPPVPEAVVLKACGCKETNWSEWSKCENNIQTREKILADCSIEKESKDCEEIIIDHTSSCAMWLYTNIILTVASIIALIIAGCVLQWIEPISMGIAIALVSITLISWGLWGWICVILKRFNPVISCALLLKTIDILDWLETLSGILAIVAIAIGLLPCALSFAISWGLVTTVKKYLVYLARFVNCMPNPWFRN